MATTPRIHITFPSSLKLTSAEKARLGKEFKAEVIEVLTHKPGEPPPFPETNTGGTGPRPGGKSGVSSKAKSAKKKK